MSLEIVLCAPALEFTPERWLRVVSESDGKLTLDAQIDFPDAEPVGIRKAIDFDVYCGSSSRPDDFVSRKFLKVLDVYWRGAYYMAYMPKVQYAKEAENDLLSVHGLLAKDELRQIFELEVDRHLGGV